MEIIDRLVKELTTKLNAVKAEYKIILPDGTELGNLEVVKRGGVKRGPRTADYHAIYNIYLEDMEIGDVCEIDPSRYEVDGTKLASAVGVAMIRKWGAGSGTVMFNKTTGNVEFLRIL